MNTGKRERIKSKGTLWFCIVWYGYEDQLYFIECGDVMIIHDHIGMYWGRGDGWRVIILLRSDIVDVIVLTISLVNFDYFDLFALSLDYLTISVTICVIVLIITINSTLHQSNFTRLQILTHSPPFIYNHHLQHYSAYLSHLK